MSTKHLCRGGQRKYENCNACVCIFYLEGKIAQNDGILAAVCGEALQAMSAALDCACDCRQLRGGLERIVRMVVP